MPTSFLILAISGTLLATSASVAFAGTVRIENRINSSVNTGNNSANGADGEDGLPAQAGEDGSEGRDGEDGANGKNGTVIEGKSQSSVSITTTVDGKVVEDFHETVTDGKYATSSVTNTKNASVSTHVEMSAGTPKETEETQTGAALADTPSPWADQGLAAAIVATFTASSGTTTEGKGIGVWVRTVATAITAFIHDLFGFEG